MKKILGSIITIGIVAAVAVGASMAYFSDTETSTENTFTAGTLDLQVDSQSHYAGLTCTAGDWVEDVQETSSRPDLIGQACEGTWPEKNLVDEKFFNLSDVKPGDYGENTISLDAVSNDQYVCASIYNLVDDNLASELNFFAWNDTNGDNIWNNDEVPLFADPYYGPASDVLNGVVYPLYTPATTELAEGNTGYVGLYWCYGSLSVGEHTLSCDGSSVTNVSQGGSLTADMAFYAEQSRNNDQFVCPSVESFQTPN